MGIGLSVCPGIGRGAGFVAPVTVDLNAKAVLLGEKLGIDGVETSALGPLVKFLWLEPEPLISTDFARPLLVVTAQFCNDKGAGIPQQAPCVLEEVRG